MTYVQRKTKAIVAVSLLLALSTGARAEFKDGNELMRDIESSNIVDEMVALGYVMGVADTGMGILHCVPGRAQAKQLVDMVHHYLRSNPAERHRAADVIVVRALSKVWPCAKRTPS